MWTFGIVLREWLEVGHFNKEILTSALTWTQHYITWKPVIISQGNLWYNGILGKVNQMYK